MEMRMCQGGWMRQVAGRWRRVAVFLAVLSVLMAAQLLSSHVTQGTSPVAERSGVTPSPSVAAALRTPSPPPPSPSAGGGGGGGAAAGGAGGAGGGAGGAGGAGGGAAAASGGGGGGGTEEKKKEGKSVTPKPTKKVNVKGVKGRQTEGARTKLLDTVNTLETRELQHLLRLFNSYKNPKTVDKIRMDHALQALKVGLLEEVSARNYPDIMEAATRARPVSTLARPQPVQVIIATTWRSGSTFLEELLSSHPGVYTHYEPLIHYGLKQVRGGSDAAAALRLVLDLLSCRYTGHDDYMQSAKEVKELVARNKLVWNACSSAELGDALCYNENFLSQACRLYPWSTMKLVRLRLRTLRLVLETELTNVKIIYLVRDPRGVMNSRSATVQWCNTPDCNDPALLCSDMKDDLAAGYAMQKEFPGRLLILRYEDLALNPVNKTRELLSGLGLDFDSHIKEFIDSHTTKNYDKPWSTSRDSKTRITYWASKLREKRLHEIQAACGSVMASFGYLTVNSTKEVTLDKVLGPMMPDVPKR